MRGTNNQGPIGQPNANLTRQNVRDSTLTQKTRPKYRAGQILCQPDQPPIVAR